MNQEPAELLQLKHAIELHRSGRLREAKEHYERLHRLYPGNPVVLTGLGTLEAQAGSPARAVELLDRSIGFAFNQPVAHANRANALLELKRYAEALEGYDSAIRLNPNYTNAYFHRAKALAALERHEDALRDLEVALKLAPADASMHLQRGIALAALKRFDEARESFEQSLGLNPDLAAAHASLGAALFKLKRFEDAIDVLDEALRRDTRLAVAYYNKAATLRELGQISAAVDCCNRAIDLEPGLADAHALKAHLKILRGEYEEGWELLEWRWKVQQKKAVRNFAQPLWLGHESIRDKVLLIHAEMGLGDTLHFCRYAALARDRGARVILEVQAPLVSLLEASLDGASAVLAQGTALPDFDFHCPTMSLPHAFRTTVATIPARIPYLSAPESKRVAWRQRIGGSDAVRVGLTWFASALHDTGPAKSVPLAQMARLFELPLEFHILQKDMPVTDRPILEGFANVRIHSDDLEDFSDTAAIVDLMDLIVTVDTSVAHLAGAIGKETWILLPYAADYRWMLDRSDSPWYPTATLIRQPQRGDWEGAITTLYQRLAAVRRPQ